MKTSPFCLLCNCASRCCTYIFHFIQHLRIKMWTKVWTATELKSSHQPGHTEQGLVLTVVAVSRSAELWLNVVFIVRRTFLLVNDLTIYCAHTSNPMIWRAVSLASKCSAGRASCVHAFRRVFCRNNEPHWPCSTLCTFLSPSISAFQHAHAVGDHRLTTYKRIVCAHDNTYVHCTG